ncbi:uncharacterized protein PG998_006250 [Apiospora kogelbergensis]|uniref:uncharacterized protein n=1 Tax=Apiospora kogelbergensis TaxID=1337665 RepID=UPI00312CF69D
MSGQQTGDDDDEQLRPPAYFDAEGRSLRGASHEHGEAERLPPVILIMAGRFVHPETARAAPLYELSQDVDRLARCYSTHTLERLEHGVALTARNVPRITRRRRRVYNLKHVSPALSPSFPFQAEALSRQSLGNLGLCRPAAALLRVPYFQPEGACRVVLLKERRDGGAGLPKGYNAYRHAETEAGQVFEFQQRQWKQKGDVKGESGSDSYCQYEWVMADGGRLAIEDDADGQHKLVVTSAVTRQTMDALVACWCLRLWRHNYEAEPAFHGWSRFTNKVRDVRQKLAMAPTPSTF